MNIRERLEESVEFLRRTLGPAPRVGIVLGTGFGDLCPGQEIVASLNYKDLPHFSTTTVEGHKGCLKITAVDGTRYCALQGRNHLYEGVAPANIVHPARSLSLWGVRSFLLTGAAGGVNPSLRPGDLMLIRDHLNLTGANPLIGSNDESLGPRFPDMTNAYSHRLVDLARSWAKENNVGLREGVYAAVQGPNFETPAEIRMIRSLGADAVGMSVVPEVIALNHMGREVLAISGISNVAAVASAGGVEHAGVLKVIGKMRDQVGSLVRWFVSREEDW